MRQLTWALVTAIFFLGGLTGGANMANAAQEGMAGPTIVAANPLIKIDKKATVVIIGSGFKPGQEIRILFKPLDGIFGDIGYALKPYPVPNKVGAFVTTWTCGRHLNKNIVESAYSLTATTMEYEVLAQTPIAFYKEKAKEEKKK